MNDLHQFMNKFVDVEISGKTIRRGTMIDLGLDLMVLYSKQQYYYIPLMHVQKVRADQPSSSELYETAGDPPIDHMTDSLSFRKILHHAKGQFVEIYVTGNKSLHGYLTSIMNDYFVFYSPVYKCMFISMNHLKWLIPYRPDITPYSLNHQMMPFSPVHVSLTRTFVDLCKRLEGDLVMFDLGDHPDKIGLLQKVEQQTIELVNASCEKVYWNLQHLKMVNVP